MVSQFHAHVKHQLCCGNSLGQGLGLQPTAPEVEAEDTDHVSAGFAHPQSRGDTVLGLSLTGGSFPHAHFLLPTEQLGHCIVPAGQGSPGPDPEGLSIPMEGSPCLYLMPTTSTACSLAVSSRCRQDFSVVPKVMLGWAEGMESAVIPNNILQSKAMLC